MCEGWAAGVTRNHGGAGAGKLARLNNTQQRISQLHTTLQHQHRPAYYPARIVCCLLFSFHLLSVAAAHYVLVISTVFRNEENCPLNICCKSWLGLTIHRCHCTLPITLQDVGQFLVKGRHWAPGTWQSFSLGAETS